MSDVYIVYANGDRHVAEKLEELLSSRWDVWWDDKIVGNFADVIERELPRAKCVIPLWSPTSRTSEMVRDELSLAKNHGIEIIPAHIANCAAPYGFGGLSSVDLRGWTGQPDHSGFRQLLRKLSIVVPPRQKPSRPVAIADGRVSLPTLFLSVSSHETQLVPHEAVKALRAFQTPTILISAYDMVPSRRSKALLAELTRFRRQGGFVLIDSGNYEASRLKDASWSTAELKQALGDTPHDLAFCFDVMEPAKDPNKAVKQIVRAVERDRCFTAAPVAPIVHAPKLRQVGHDLEHIPEIVRDIADQLQPPVIAIPERELGPGLIARAKTVRRIRLELDKLPFYQPLHLLGTGNPWSIAVLAAAGADSFDGLEWCRVAVDRDTGRLHHYQHYDFFTYQAELADSPLTAGAVRDERVVYAGKVAFHNLDYYRELGSRLRQAAAKGDFEAFVVGLIGQANTTQLSKQMPELFG